MMKAFKKFKKKLENFHLRKKKNEKKNACSERLFREKVETQ